MSYVEKLCTKCCHLLGVDENDKDDECDCGGKLISLELEHDDYITLCNIWTTGNEVDYTVHWDLYNAMVELKKTDIIKYNLKMSQFRNQVEQQKSIQKQNDTTPRCPNCHSSNIQKIGGLERAGSVAMLGAFSKKINKSFKCKSCGYTW